MNPLTEIGRRIFIKAIAAMPVMVWAGCKRPSAPVPPNTCTAIGAPGLSEHRKFFNTDQWATIEAAAARILPTDDEPGAKEAGVIHFIDAELSLPEHKDHQRLFLLGIRKMDQLALRKTQKTFVQAPFSVQDGILRKLQSGVLLSRKTDSKRFFSVLVAYTLEGFLCDPVYGGNRNEVGWKFIGFNMKPPRPRCPMYIQMKNNS